MAEITLLDGGIGQELVRRSGDRPTPLWSTQVMLDHPELVEGLHRDFFAAGATVATTNTYAVLRDRLERVGLADRIGELTERAIRAAWAARDAQGAGRVAGALGPLVASYQPHLVPEPEAAARLYAEPVGLLKGGVDLILIETMASVHQAEGALRAATGQGVPVWLGVTVSDTDGRYLRSGEELAALVPLIETYAPAAVLVNCSPPEAITAALEIVRNFGVPFGAYANGFTRISEGFLGAAPTVDALETRTDLGPEDYARFAMKWVGQGASIVGGCCEVGPAHIAEVASALREAGHEII